MGETMEALEQFDIRCDIGCLVLTGNERAFAAGADIKEMANATPVDMLDNPFIDYWDRLRKISKPVIAAVSGFALGGGCELAMACDMIVASESAKFGQPEINLGVIPGAGGTQRLTLAVGKAMAMEMVLNGRFLSADEAYQFGLVNRVVPVENHLEETVKLAAKSPPAPRSPCEWPKKRSTPSLKCRSAPAWPTSAAFSTCSSAPKTRKRVWMPLSTSARPSGRGGKCSVVSNQYSS
jgi:enoyl-CoA hydratase/carnithine racemase